MGFSKDLMLRDHPRPNIKELPGLYAELDNLVKRAEIAIRNLPKPIFDKRRNIIYFRKMTESEFKKLVARDSSTMVIALTRVCGLSDREFSRLFGLKNVYNLRESWRTDQKGRATFTRATMSLLPKQMHLETFLYTFYKMWEEHQKRHYRAKFEEDVRAFFRAHGYECEKIAYPIEVNGAIPPSTPQVVMQVRTGVRKDLVKRAKEFSSEFDKSRKAFLGAKFMAIFKIPPHELDRRNEIRQVIVDQRKGKKPYDAVLFQDELNDALRKLKRWGISKTSSPVTTLKSSRTKTAKSKKYQRAERKRI
jgi:hypothetical protein